MPNSICGLGVTRVRVTVLTLSGSSTITSLSVMIEIVMAAGALTPASNVLVSSIESPPESTLKVIAESRGQIFEPPDLESPPQRIGMKHF